MKENADGMPATNSVVKLRKIPFEHVCISCLYDFHAHSIQGLDRLVDGAMFLIIICVVKPGKGIIFLIIIYVVKPNKGG